MKPLTATVSAPVATKPLGRVAEFIMGQAPPGGDCNKERRGTVFVKAGEFDDRFPIVCEWTTRPLKLAKSGDVLVCVVGATAGKINLAIDCAIGRSVAAIRPSAHLATEFLYHFLATKVLFLRAKSQGLAQGVITRDMLNDLEIPLPPLVEQRRIAAVLDRAAVLRAKRHAVLAQLDSLTQSLFLDLFGDSTTNPKGWPKATLGDVTEMVTGYPFRSEEYVTNGNSIRLCRGANILPGRIDWRVLARWPESKIAELAEFGLEAGDVVIAMDRPWISEGFKIARVQPEDCPALLVQRVARLRGGKKLPNAFLFHLLNQPAFTRHCRPTETTIPHISPKDIGSFIFPVPPIELQREFARRVQAVEKLKLTQRASLAELGALFATLQHRAFRGEL